MTTLQILSLADAHLTAREFNDAAAKVAPTGDVQSARLCLDSAYAITAKPSDERTVGDLTDARRWALKGLAYLIGVFHPDYVKAST